MIDILPQLWDTFVAEDAPLVEVNPLVKDGVGKVVALDGKVSLDDNADFGTPTTKHGVGRWVAACCVPARGIERWPP